ncbi:hypothetical protein QR680_012674 [Steinernema hermaphroditum]|uniref:RNA-directed DNA polymerase n=1 Tax=Steinernema hermaphroditum TaxID=289476 RepID=A0AA39I2S8_9BILA|nr:hypothetical protein QR680_012674 [Steinernema hermaphroditum]
MDRLHNLPIFDSEVNDFSLWFQAAKNRLMLLPGDTTDKQKAALLVSMLNMTAFGQLCTRLQDKDKELDDCTPEDIKTELTAAFEKKKLLFTYRRECWTMQQPAHMPLDDWYKSVTKAVQKFDYKSFTEEELAVMIYAQGLHNPQLKEHLLLKLAERKADEKTDLEAVHQEAMTKNQVRNEVKTRPEVAYSSRRKPFNQVAGLTRQFDSSKKSPAKPKSPMLPPSPCYGCCEMHFNRDCPFKTKKCPDCQQVGHKKGFCKRPKDKHVHAIDVSSPKSKRNASIDASTKKYVSIQVNGVPVEVLVDSGSDINLINEDTWFDLDQPRLRPAENVFSASNGSSCGSSWILRRRAAMGWKRSPRPYSRLLQWTATHWKPCASCNWNGRHTSQVEAEHIRATLHQKFPKLFEPTLGHSTKFTANIERKADAKPVFRKARPLPRTETVRVCNDYSTGLNNQLEMNRHPMPTVEDMLTSLTDAQFFSSIDMADAFLQIRHKLLTINTHKGLFGSPFEVKPTTGIFQQIMDNMLIGIPGSLAYLDDIIVTGVDKSDHLKNLEFVLQRIQDYGLRLRLEKCRFLLPEVKYLGMVVNARSITTDKTKIEAILKMPSPENVQQARSLLGTVNYYGRFLSGLHHLRPPIERLLQKDVKWHWSEKCEEAFAKLKEVLSSPLFLAQFDSSAEHIVAADASEYGIGCALLQRTPDGNIRAVAYAVKTLTSAQRKYGQIEKEAYALTYAVRKFHKYIAGRHFVFQTDHKPLVAIFASQKGVPTLSASRLQQYALTLLNYDFEIQHVSTDKFGHADALSRFIAEQRDAEEDELKIFHTSADTGDVFLPKTKSSKTNTKSIQNLRFRSS